MSGKLSESIIKKKNITSDKDCGFEFKPIKNVDMEKLLLTIKSDKPSGLDNLGYGRLLQLSPKLVAKPLYVTCLIYV